MPSSAANLASWKAGRRRPVTSKPKAQAPQPEQAEGSKASSYPETSPLSVEATEKLMEVHNTLLARRFSDPRALTEASTLAFQLNMRHVLTDAPAAMITPDLRPTQEKLLYLQSALKELDDASMETLPRELQELKRHLAKRTDDKPMTNADAEAVPRRINELLLANGEKAISIDFYDAFVEAQNGNATGKEQQHFMDQLMEIAKRKPQLVRQIMAISQENSDRKAQPSIAFRAV